MGTVEVGQKIMPRAQGPGKRDILWLTFLFSSGLVAECRAVLPIQNSISPGRTGSSVTSQLMGPIIPWPAVMSPASELLEYLF